MSDSVLDRIRKLLHEAAVPFQQVEHAPTYTSEESALARGESLSVGAKAILMKTDSVFRLFILAADRKLDSAAIKTRLGAKKLRFATAIELHDLTGLVPGCIPPFGPPVLPFELFADFSLGQQDDRIAFNAGSLTTSIIMAASDWGRVANPSRFAFSQ